MLQPEKILAEALVHGIVVLDNKHFILWFNNQAADLLALKSETTHSIETVFADSKFSYFLNANQDEVLEIYAPNNQNKRLSIYLRPYLEDQKVLIIQDISSRHRLEKMRQDFIANVSHELRTPLTVFRGYLEMCLDNPELDKETLRHIFLQMNKQDQRMERLVCDLLLLSRLESADPDTEKHEIVNVASLIRQIHQDICSFAKNKRHQFKLTLEDSLVLKGEPHELRSAFSNLLVNAVNYTPDGGKIFINWYCDKAGKHFEVTDTGIGIEEKYLERLTQRFYRVDKARSRDLGGTGLGLAIVKHVLIRHQGELHIDSTPNVGSTFRCSFPTAV